MDTLEYLTQGYKEMQRMIASMCGVISDPNLDQLGRSTIKSLSESASSFWTKLKTYEELEEAFIKETIKALPENKFSDPQIKFDHESINEVFGILNALITFDQDPYSIRFALSSLDHHIARHLAHEEKELFPLIRNILPSSQLKSLGARLSSAT